jgi:hypothetical protein
MYMQGTEKPASWRTSSSSPWPSTTQKMHTSSDRYVRQFAPVACLYYDWRIHKETELDPCSSYLRIGFRDWGFEDQGLMAFFPRKLCSTSAHDTEK